MASVFGQSNPDHELPVPILEPTAPLPSSFSESFEHESKCATAVRPRGSYQDIIVFKLTLSERELEDMKVSRALEKWYLLFRTGRQAWPAECDLDRLIDEDRVMDLRRFFGSRSSGTILKRGNAMLKF